MVLEVTALELMNRDISSVPHTFNLLKKLLRKRNYLLLEKTKYWPNKLRKAFRGFQ